MRKLLNIHVYPYCLNHILFNEVFTSNSACSAGRFGDNCQYVCGQCADEKPCDHVNGSCYNGCREGWHGTRCGRQGIMKSMFFYKYVKKLLFKCFFIVLIAVEKKTKQAD